LLVDSWTTPQRDIYRKLKDVQTEINKRFIEDKDILCSCHLKTLMLWAAEDKPPEFWLETCILTSAKN